MDRKAPGFDAYLPDMGNEHKYLCGDWLLEREIGTAEYPIEVSLTGVNTGSDVLDSFLNPLVRLPKSFTPDTATVKLKAIFHLPRPNRITPYVQGKLQPDAFTGDTPKFDRQPTYVAGLRVFEYTFSDYNSVLISDQSSGKVLWQCPEPATLPAQNLKVASVHIYNEPGEPLSNPADHATREFNLSLKFLRADITLINSATIPLDPELPDREGFLPGETSTLDSRSVTALKLLTAARQGQSTTVTNPKPGTNPTPGTDAGGAGGSQVCGGANGLVIS